jgi:lysophospholipase L1-like esterase
MVPLRISSNLLTYSAWLSDRFYGLPDLSEADNLTQSRWWTHTLQAQVRHSQRLAFEKGLFGDSISSGLGLMPEGSLFNFALGGLSSTSLVHQLKALSAAEIKVPQVAIAIGTNDALYGTSDLVIARNVQQSIRMVQEMGADRIHLLGAFYATERASQNPWLAGPNQRITEINDLLEEVASQERIYFVWDELQALFNQTELNPSLTGDGVHLNALGKQIYRQILLDVFQTNR